MALSVIFGIEHIVSAVLIFVSAALGAVLRRTVARYSANVFIQPFCAALVAGVIGALAVRYQLSSSLRLLRSVHAWSWCRGSTYSMARSI